MCSGIRFVVVICVCMIVCCVVELCGVVGIWLMCRLCFWFGCVVLMCIYSWLVDCWMRLWIVGMYWLMVCESLWIVYCLFVWVCWLWFCVLVVWCCWLIFCCCCVVIWWWVVLVWYVGCWVLVMKVGLCNVFFRWCVVYVV